MAGSVVQRRGKGVRVTKKLWDVNELAEFLGMAVGSVYHLCSENRVPCIRLSARCLRFDPDEIQAWVSRQAREQQQAAKGKVR